VKFKGENVMKRLITNALITAGLVMGANGMTAASATDDWLDNFYKAKLGRAIRTEAREANTVYREEATRPEVRPANTWLEDFFRAKFGRSTPMEEARLKAERANTVYREETAPAPVAPANTWLDELYKAKYGRPYPVTEKR